MRERILGQLKRKYDIFRNDLNVVIELLKQRIVAKAAKTKRYKSRVDQYQKNRLFQNNQKRLFAKLERLETDNSTIPDAEESREYWDSIWGKQVKQLEKDRARIEKQSDIEITPEMIAKRANNLLIWKAPGPDDLQGTG